MKTKKENKKEHVCWAGLQFWKNGDVYKWRDDKHNISLIENEDSAIQHFTYCPECGKKIKQ
jgi:hypothetical protein